MITTSDRKVGRLIRLASITLLFAATPWLALAATPESDLRALIESQDELRAVFGESATYRGSDSRAEAFAKYGSSRHAIVMYKAHNGSSGLGQKLCHAALGRKERNDWVDQLALAAGGDRLVAEYLADSSSPTIRFKRTEYSSLSDWKGRHVGVCAVPEANIKTEYPGLPDSSSVRSAAYDVGKKLYTEGRKGEALERFKTLKSDKAIYPNALLFIVVILQEERPDIAEVLHRKHVDISKADDPDAIEVYTRTRSEKALP